MRRASLVAASIAILCCTQPLAAQGSGCTANDSTVAGFDTIGIKPDLLFRATVRARTVRFAGVPQQELKLLGCGGRDSFRVTTRDNLPRPIQPNVTYSNAVISIEIRSYFSCVVNNAALGSVCPAGDSASVRRKRQ